LLLGGEFLVLFVEVLVDSAAAGVAGAGALPLGFFLLDNGWSVIESFVVEVLVFVVLVAVEPAAAAAGAGLLAALLELFVLFTLFTVLVLLATGEAAGAFGPAGEAAGAFGLAGEAAGAAGPAGEAAGAFGSAGEAAGAFGSAGLAAAALSVVEVVVVVELEVEVVDVDVLAAALRLLLTAFPCASTTVSLTVPSGLVCTVTVSPGFVTVVALVATSSVTVTVPSPLTICPSCTVVTLFAAAGMVKVPPAITTATGASGASGTAGATFAAAGLLPSHFSYSSLNISSAPGCPYMSSI